MAKTWHSHATLNYQYDHGKQIPLTPEAGNASTLGAEIDIFGQKLPNKNPGLDFATQLCVIGHQISPKHKDMLKDTSAFPFEEEVLGLKGLAGEGESMGGGGGGSGGGGAGLGLGLGVGAVPRSSPGTGPVPPSAVGGSAAAAAERAAMSPSYELYALPNGRPGDGLLGQDELAKLLSVSPQPGLTCVSPAPLE